MVIDLHFRDNYCVLIKACVHAMSDKCIIGKAFAFDRKSNPADTVSVTLTAA